MNLKKNRKVFTSKSVGTGPSSYEKRYLPGRGLTKVEKHCTRIYWQDIYLNTYFHNMPRLNSNGFVE